jgi:hypothetical protein
MFNRSLRDAALVIQRLPLVLQVRKSRVRLLMHQPHNTLAIYNSDGYVTIYCSTQGQFIIRTLTAALLGMPEGKVRVIPAEIGGGFGGKTTVYLEPSISFSLTGCNMEAYNDWVSPLPVSVGSSPGECLVFIDATTGVGLAGARCQRSQ